MLAQQLAHIDFLDETIERVSGEIAERLRPFDALLVNLDAIPGVGRRTAETLLAEAGTHLVRRLKALGYDVQIQSCAA